MGPTSDDSTHHHYAAVDLCAPGYHIWSATNTTLSKATGNTFNLSYDWGDGTSFSAPLVAGLLLAIEPCLTPADIEYILKTSSDNIYGVLDNYKYAGKLDAGRLNAFNACRMALSYKAEFVQNQTFTPSGLSDYIAGNTIIAGSNVTTTLPAGAVTLNSGSDVSFNARNYIEMKPGFEAKTGSAFSFNVDPAFSFRP